MILLILKLLHLCLISADCLALWTSLLLVLSNLSVFVQRTLDLGKCFGMPWPILECISTSCIIIRINNLHCAGMFSLSFEVGWFVTTKILNWVQRGTDHRILYLLFLYKDCVVENLILFPPTLLNCVKGWRGDGDHQFCSEGPQSLSRFLIWSQVSVLTNYPFSNLGASTKDSN